MQVWHLHVSIHVQLQDFCKRDYPAKRRIRRVPAIDQDDAVWRLFGQHVPGHPGSAVSEALTHGQLQIPARISGEPVHEGHCFTPVGIAFFLAQPDHLFAVCPQYFRDGFQQCGFAGPLGPIQSNKQRTIHVQATIDVRFSLPDPFAGNAWRHQANRVQGP